MKCVLVVAIVASSKCRSVYLLLTFTRSGSAVDPVPTVVLHFTLCSKSFTVDPLPRCLP